MKGILGCAYQDRKRLALNCKSFVQGKRLWNLIIWPEYGGIELKVGCVNGSAMISVRLNGRDLRKWITELTERDDVMLCVVAL